MSRLAFVMVAAAFLAPTLVGQRGQDTQGAYSAVAMGTGGGVGGKSMHFDFRISSYTTDEEVDQLAALLKEKGPDALRRAMEKLDVGRIRPTSGVGNQIAVARKRQDGSNTVITVSPRDKCPSLNCTETAERQTTRSDSCKLSWMKRAREPAKSWRLRRFGSTKRKGTTRLRATAINTSKLSTFVP